MDPPLSPRKKRCPSTGADEALVTPKKLRVQAYALPTPRSSAPTIAKSTSDRGEESAEKPGLPVELQCLLDMQATLQQTLSHALATCGISPTEDKGHVPNVINHLSLRKQGYSLDDLRRLAWLWQWDGKSLPEDKSNQTEENNDNPFLEKKPMQEDKEWSIGTSGIIITPATQFIRETGKRVAVYGIGIEVEMDIDKGFSDGMAAVARWAADGQKRKSNLRKKLLRWVEFHSDTTPVPFPPQYFFPALQVSSSLQAFSMMRSRMISRSPSPTKGMGSPSILLQSPRKSPAKSTVTDPSPDRQWKIPFPTGPSSTAVPQTPSRKALHNGPENPASSSTTTPSTVRILRTPTSERRAALYERVRQRSLSNTPTTSPTKLSFSKQGLKAMSADLMRRRVLLGRLPNVAENIWMLFSGPASSTQERRALRISAVVHSVVKSASVPISDADAEESISLLVELCPFFLKKLAIGREEWLEMPAPEPDLKGIGAGTSSDPLERPSTPIDSPSTTSSPKRIRVPTSPGSLSRRSNNVNLLHKSPRTVGSARGALHQVRELIRRELDSYD